ncbi:MAG: sulfotransferase [Pseudomonadota bacterium]
MQGLAAHRAGNLGAAEKAYKQVLKQQSRNGDALHLLGVIALHRNDAERAVYLIGRALSSAPQEPTYLNNMANALKAQGNLASAAEHAQKAVSFRPGYAEALNTLGTIYLAESKAQQAIEAFQTALRARPDYTEAAANLGDAFLAIGQAEAARESYQKALAAAPRNVDVLLRLGRLAFQIRSFDEAGQIFSQACRLAPGRPEPYLYLGNVLNWRGDHRPAVATYDKAIALDPTMVEAYLNRGHSRRALGLFADAESDYRHADTLRSDDIQPLRCLAEMFEALNRLDEAANCLSLALERAQNDPECLCLAGVLARRRGDLPEALAKLRTALEQTDDPERQSPIHFELGKTLDRYGDADQAFDHFAKGNRLYLNNPKGEVFDKEGYVHRVRALKDFMSGLKAPLPLGASASAPVFLIGFPRSGTTLLDQILDAHSAVHVIEETPLLEPLWRRIETWGHYPQALGSLTEERLAELRALYFAELERQTGVTPDKQIVDKFPLNSIHCALAYQVFPEARFIVALRHPCDVVLSCFMQHFFLNDAMANFTNLDDSVDLYVEVMGLLQRYRDRLPLHVHEIRYEDVVDNFEGTIASLLTFLNLDWEDQVRDFSSHAKNRKHINTPSYSQVSEPLYNRAKFRWLAYRQHLAPQLPKLAPFIDSFGYET